MPTLTDAVNTLVSNTTTLQTTVSGRITDMDGKITQANTAKVAAETAKAAAEIAKGLADTAKTDAETAQTLAENAKTAAETAQGIAATAKTDALVAKAATDTAKGNAESAQTAAESARTDAQQWATKTDGAVSGGEYSAKYHATAASTSASAAATTLADRYTKAETDAKVVELSPPATKAHVDSLGINAGTLTGSLPAISGANLTGITTDTTTIENNIAMLGFYRATDHSKNKYNLVDQVIDDFNDATGIDAGASTNENLSSGSYGGQTSSVGSATGGTITTVGSYKYHAFHNTASNTQTSTNFVTPSSGTIDYLIVGAGGSGRSLHSGPIGGGSGGSHQYFSGQSKAAGTYPIVVAGRAPGWTNSTNGLSSSAFGTTKSGGTLGTRTSGAGTAGTTYSAFSQFGDGGLFGGGGGAQNSAGGSGGGGYGGNYGGDANAESGQNSTGGGGGSGNSGANASGGGGSGVVLIRYLTDAFTTYAVGDLTLQSTDSTASSAPSTGDLVTLIENSAGTATLNTDIKGYISRDSGANWTQGTLVDEGSWGTNKKILAFHDLDISGQPSGTAICYKITTHNQSGSKSTKIHATSLAWA